MDAAYVDSNITCAVSIQKRSPPHFGVRGLRSYHSKCLRLERGRYAGGGWAVRLCCW